MNLGVFGGAFDPPHAGHRKLARAAFAALALDRLYWVPTQDPPHKSAPGAPFPDRVAMARLAVAGMAGHEVSDIEGRLPRPSYTLNTLRALKQAHGAPGDAWFLLIGADNWAIFPAWHKPGEVLAEAVLAIYPRAGAESGPLPAGVVGLDVELTPERSTDIRALLRRGEGAQGESPAAAGLLPEVLAYIESHGLYGRGGGK